MTDPVPDVRKIARTSIIAAFDAAWGVPDRAGEKLLHEYADAVLAAVSPVIRQQERDEIRQDIAEKIELRRRAASATARDRESDTRQQVYSNGQTTAYQELAERLDRYFAERSHSTKPTGDDHDVA